MPSLKQSSKCLTSVSAVLILLLSHLPICSAHAINPSQDAFFMEAYGGLFKQSNNDTAYTLIDLDPAPFRGVDVPSGVLKRVEPGYKLSGGGALGFLSKNNTAITDIPHQKF